MRTLKFAASLIPPIARLRDARDQLLAENADLRTQLGTAPSVSGTLPPERASLIAAIEALLAAQVSQGGNPADLATELHAMLLARAQHRLFITDYPYHPEERPLAQSASGRAIIAAFERARPQIAETLAGVARHIETLGRIPRDATRPLAPLWNNPWFPPFDGATLYGLIAENRPRRFIEVGSGISTRFARQAITDLGLDTRIISIDPHPHNPIEGLCDEIIVARMEDMPTEFWRGLDASDMLFVDNSHRSFPASDVTCFFAEVMPALPPGTLFGLHDIFLPDDYPAAWKDRFYSEQYLMMTYLLGGGGPDDIVLPVNWATGQPDLFGQLASLWSRQDIFKGLNLNGGCLWLRRRTAAIG
jgi:predicted O-methyltransferase YrrM